MKFPFVRFLPLLLLLFVTSCDVTKHLPEGEKLYKGANVNVEWEGQPKKKTKAMKRELTAIVRPKPNSMLFGFPYKVYFYYLFGEPKKPKGFKNWFRETFGETPVMGSEVNLEKNREVLENRLQNKGYFHAAVAGDTIVKKKYEWLDFTARPGVQYKIRDLHFPEDSSTISKEIRRISNRTLLKPGEAYDLEVIKNERQRIDDRLKNRGYFYFSADYLIARVDSTVGGNQVDIYMHLKPTTPRADVQVYRINDIWVYPTYTIEDDSILSEAPAIAHENYYIIDPSNKFKPGTFKKMLVFKKGDKYSRRLHNRSLNRLVTMGNFKFVKARFEEVDTTGDFLDAYFFMTPLPEKSAKLEVTALTKSNNARGGEVSLNWSHRNAFKGAEQLILSTYYGLENQYNNDQRIGIQRAGVEANLYLPRIIAPISFKESSSFVPKTKLSLRYELYQRTDQYTLNSLYSSFGYVWKTSANIEHQLNVVNLNFVKPRDVTEAYQAQIDTDIILRRAIEPQFIFGPSYNFNFNSNTRSNNRLHNFFFNGNIETPGNLISLISGDAFNNESKGEGTFVGNVYSQYLRLELDFRHYLRLGDIDNKTNRLASRFLVGVGIPYGNSYNLPFIKAFFVGGVNDLRAFRARSLGPGSYHAADHYSENEIIPDQPGDIKLLASTELRAKLFSIIHGALFVDAGNIWTIHDDPERAGTRFTTEFYKQIAVGAGVGLRFDISFLVIRLDLASPVVKPYETTGKKIDFGNKDWRKENLVLNFAIGYPF